MLTSTVRIFLLTLVAACTSRGIDRSDATPLRTTLEIRPIADGDTYEEILAETAQDTRPLPEHVSPFAPLEVEVERTMLHSPALPPVPVARMRAESRATLEQLVLQAGPAPTGRAAAYEQEPDGRWSLLVVDTTEGLVLGPETALKMTDGAPGSGYEGVYLLLSREDASTFEDLTRRYHWKRLAFVDEDEVLLAPTVNEPIPGGEVLMSPGEDGTAAAMFERLAGQPPPS